MNYLGGAFYGQQGASGQQGPAGAVGASGSQGIQGIQGPTGANGPNHIQALFLYEQSADLAPVSAGEVALWAASGTHRLKRKWNSTFSATLAELNEDDDLDMEDSSIIELERLLFATSHGAQIGYQSAGASGSISMGDYSSASGQHSVAIGYGADAGASGAMVLSGGANGAQNNIAHSLLFGDDELMNVRPDSDICDLGTSLNPFKDLYLSGSVQNTEVQGLLDITSSLAPAGQRDLWALSGSTSAGSNFLIYNSDLDLVHCMYGTLAYSTNGGATYTAVTYDHAPATPLTVGFNPYTNLYVGISGFAGAYSFNSTDGINWTRRSIFAVPIWSYNITWVPSAGLFVVGTNEDSTHCIITSPDGDVWTSRLSTNIQAYFSAANSDIVVMVGPTAPYIITSTDGITWTTTSSTGLAALTGVVWIEEKKEFLAFPNVSSSTIYRSTDGLVWTSIAGILPTTPAVPMFMCEWVGGDINHYYLAGPTVNNIYSLWSTPDINKPFVGCFLDGAASTGQSYGTVRYSAIHNRFAISNNTGGQAYSTARTGVKAISDKIRVLNHPVSVCNYATYDAVNVTNTTAETDISTTSSSLGSLVFADAQVLGMVIKFDLNLLVTSTAGDTLTIRYKVNGTTLLTHTITIPALASSLPINISTSAGIQGSSTILIRSIESVSLVVPKLVVPSPPAYTSTAKNTWTITAQFGANVNTASNIQLTCSTLFVNGF